MGQGIRWLEIVVDGEPLTPRQPAEFVIIRIGQLTVSGLPGPDGIDDHSAGCGGGGVQLPSMICQPGR